MNSSRYLRNLSLSCAGMLFTIFACAHKSAPNSSGQRHFFEKRLQEREASRRPDDIEALGANFEAKELAHLNLKREYLLYTPPSYDPQKPSPLVIAFHGGTTSDARLARTTRYHKLADKKGFLVLYPNGVGGNWNDGRGTANPQIDDVSFVKALIEEVGRARKVDQRRIYATGISNGALMVQRLACEMSDRIAAFASVAGSMSVLLQEKCKPQRPVSMLIMNSPDDKFIPWQGGAMKRGAGGTLLSVDATIEFWKKWNQCKEMREEVRPKTVQSDKTRVIVTRHTNCQNNASVVLQKIEGGGHTWPGGEAQPAWLVGVTSQEVNATQETWNFFEKQSLQ